MNRPGAVAVDQFTETFVALLIVPFAGLWRGLAAWMAERQEDRKRDAERSQP